MVQENQVSEREKIVSGIEAEGLVAIVRVPRPELTLPLAKALVAGGIRAVELTMSIPNALEAVRTIDRELGDKILLGVGTVIDDDTCRAAIDAGAKYVISPITRPSLVAAAHALDRPVMLGAYTPTEAQAAHEAGSDFVKIFPADTLGPSYIKSLLAPLPHLKIVPTGGVNLDTMEAYLAAGSAALGTGSALLKKELIAGENWGERERLARRLRQRRAGFAGQPYWQRPGSGRARGVQPVGRLRDDRLECRRAGEGQGRFFGVQAASTRRGDGGGARPVR